MGNAQLYVSRAGAWGRAFADCRQISIRSVQSSMKCSPAARLLKGLGLWTLSWRSSRTSPYRLGNFSPASRWTLKQSASKPSRRSPPNAMAHARRWLKIWGDSCEVKPILARPVGRVERVWRWCRRKPAGGIITALAAVALIAVAGVSTWSAVTLSRKNAELTSRTERLGTFVQRLYSELLDFNVDEAPPRQKRARPTAQKLQRNHDRSDSGTSTRRRC